MTRDRKGYETINLVVAKTKAVEKAVTKKPKNEVLVRDYPFKFVEKKDNEKSLEGKFQKEITNCIKRN